MLETTTERIEKIEADAIVNASNGIGYMGGKLGRFIRLAGVAESIHYATKGQIEGLAKEHVAKHPVQEGDVFITDGASLGIPVLHAVTMNRPGTRSNLKAVETCLKNLVKTVNQHGFNRVAIPYLGTGTGKLKKTDVHQLFETYLANEKTTYIISEPKK